MYGVPSAILTYIIHFADASIAVAIHLILLQFSFHICESFIIIFVLFAFFVSLHFHYSMYWHVYVCVCGFPYIISAFMAQNDLLAICFWFQLAINSRLFVADCKDTIKGAKWQCHSCTGGTARLIYLISHFTGNKVIK